MNSRVNPCTGMEIDFLLAVFSAIALSLPPRSGASRQFVSPNYPIRKIEKPIAKFSMFLYSYLYHPGKISQKFLIRQISIIKQNNITISHKIE
jgi:hypothetical protein